MFHQYRKCHSILQYLPLSHLYLLLQDHIQDVLHQDTVEYGTADKYQKALQVRHVYTVCHTLLGERCISDCSGSQRKSFVGIDSYDVGREYGRQIIREANSNTKEALILMNAAAEDTGQNIIFNGIQETLANEGNHLNLTLTARAVMADSQFGGAEEIRSIFQEYYLHPETMPEIIVCLNEQNTVSVCQAVVDFNLVGQVDILGYFATETILNAIDRNVIAASIAVDTQQLGIRSVEALDEYLETGYVSDFVAMDVNTVTKDNVKGYLRNASPDKG